MISVGLVLAMGYFAKATVTWSVGSIRTYMGIPASPVRIYSRWTFELWVSTSTIPAPNRTSMRSPRTLSTRPSPCRSWITRLSTAKTS